MSHDYGLQQQQQQQQQREAPTDSQQTLASCDILFVRFVQPLHAYTQRTLFSWMVTIICVYMLAQHVVGPLPKQHLTLFIFVV